MTEPKTLLACPFCGAAAEIKRLGCRACSSLVGCTECHAELEANENAWDTGMAWNVRAGAHGHGTTDGSRFAAFAASTGYAPTRSVYAITCLMTKGEPNNTAFTGTLSVREASSPAEAKGMAVEWALQAKPGYSVHEILIQEVKAQNDQAEVRGMAQQTQPEKP